MLDLVISGSGKGGWAFVAHDGDRVVAEGCGGEAGAGAWRMYVTALHRGVGAVPQGPLRICCKNDALRELGQRRLSSDAGIPPKLQARPLLEDIQANLLARRVQWVAVANTNPWYKRAKAAATDAAVAADAAHTPAAPASKEKLTTSAEVVIWCDGGCRRNPGPGGWGTLVVHTGSGATLELRGGEDHTTNNRMEMTAALEGLRALTRRSRVEMRADSRYVIDVCTRWIPAWKRRGWRKADGDEPLNLDLVQALDVETARHEIRWTWVRGHSGDPGNEHVDALANQAMDLVAIGESPSLSRRHATPPADVGLPR